MIVGLDEEGVERQHIDQQVPGGVHHGPHAAAFQSGQQPLVGGLCQAGRDAARQNQDVSVLQGVQLGFQRLHGALRDVGARAVQLGLLPCLDLDVDAGHPLGQVDEIGLDALGGQAALQPGTRLPGHKAQGDAFAAQLGQHTGYVDALAAQHAVFAAGTVYLAHFQRGVQPHHIINGRVECYRVDHSSVSFISVYCLYLGLGQRLVRMAPPCSSVMTAG